MTAVLFMPAKYDRDERWLRFGAYLESLRRDLAYERKDRITQTDVADRAGMTYKQYSRIANGESGTRFETVRRLAAALELRHGEPRFVELFQRAGFAPPEEMPEPAPAAVRDPATVPDSVYDFFNDDTISDQAKRSIIATIEAIEAMRDEAVKRERAEREAVERAERERKG